MVDEDLLKKIKAVIKDELRPIKDTAEMTKKKVDSQQLFIHSVTENVRTIKEQQSLINEKIDEVRTNQDQHTEGLETLKASVIGIEQTNKIYGDMYKLNNDNMKKLEKRMESIEENTGIESPPELTLAELP